jgi:enoyl-CoA hydratase
MEVLNTGTDKLIGKKSENTGWLIFNNPDKRNAVSLEMWEAIPSVMRNFEDDPNVRVVIVTGAGEKAFVSGADISQFDKLRSSVETNQAYSKISSQGRKAIKDFTKPTIAMVQGFCIGGGMAVALACDLIIATNDSKFGIPAARLGLGYGFEGAKRLVQVIGPTHAKDMFFTARHYTAEEAYNIGLVNRVTSVEQLEETVQTYAKSISENAPLTIQAGKLAIEESLLSPEERNVTAMDAAIQQCFASEDYQEGRKAFEEKRRPVFKGK